MQRDNTASPGGQHDEHAAAAPAGLATPTPPPATWHDLTPLQRELAARLAGLRGPRCGQPHTDAARGPQARATSPGRNSMHREPIARAGGARPPTAPPSAPATPSRPASDNPPGPAAAHPSCPNLAGRQTETAGRNALHRERPVAPLFARLTPTKAETLRTTTLANTWTPDLAAQFAQRFGHPIPAPGWRAPQAMPATDPVANAMRSFLAGQQRPTPPAAQGPATDRPCPPGAGPGEANNMIPRPAISGHILMLNAYGAAPWPSFPHPIALGCGDKDIGGRRHDAILPASGTHAPGGRA